MLEKVDLKKKMAKKDFEEQFPKVRERLRDLQKELFEAGVPMLIIFEGWDAAGKGTMIEKLVGRLDPRGFKVHRIKAPTLEEQFRPFLWRFWTKTPGKGRIGIFDRSWYGRVLVDRMEKNIGKTGVMEAFDEIKNFERQLVDDGTVIVKFWLHISKKEQKKRFKTCEADKYESWKIEKEDWKHHKQYDKWAEAVEDTLDKTSTAYAPWTVIEATDNRWAQMRIFNTVLEYGLQSLDKKRKLEAAQKVQSQRTEDLTHHVRPTILDRIDLSSKLDEKKYRAQLGEYALKLRRLEFEMYRKRVPLVVAFEGWDAAGKGGTIKRLTSEMDPRGYEVVPIAAPTREEKDHHHLWRFWNQIPKAGHISIFDRTWYGRVLVERIEGFCSEDAWRRAYQEIREFETSLSNYGMLVLKFWIHISKEEQARRFKERQELDYKNWKITDEDWRNRQKWEDYEEAVLDLLENTSTPKAPWIIVAGEDKNTGRIQVLKEVTDALERHLKKL